ncbi:hypothetical protein [Shouchella miscanthi]|uniref:Uncharacterized protein n=1 Tax=Shouchella miscanthi TaxID=2598861 RepID=A0ABU6NLB6_9BACI|nr:hypothetical protein [Shouchella miscanthi]
MVGGLIMRETYELRFFDDHFNTLSDKKYERNYNLFNKSISLKNIVSKIQSSIEESLIKANNFVQDCVNPDLEIHNNEASSLYYVEGIDEMRKVVMKIDQMNLTDETYLKFEKKLEAFLKMTDLKHMGIPLNETRVERLLDWVEEVTERIFNEFEAERIELTFSRKASSSKNVLRKNKVQSVFNIQEAYSHIEIKSA